jgi:hypothetical protein
MQFDIPWFGNQRVAAFGPFSHLLGPNAEEKLTRFKLKLTKKDAYYIYLEVVPHAPSDRMEFTRAQVVLFAQNYFLARWWTELPNGDEVTWNIADVDTAVRLKTSHFQRPDAPPGWKTERILWPRQGEANDSPAPKFPNPTDNRRPKP